MPVGDYRTGSVAEDADRLLRGLRSVVHWVNGCRDGSQVTRSLIGCLKGPWVTCPTA